MRNNVQSVARLLKSAGIETEISNYPISDIRSFLGQGIFVAQISAIIGLLLTDANKFQKILFVWLIGNFVRQFLVQTGAMEIWLGDSLVWSTLTEGRLPTIADLVSRFARVGVHLR
jgi:hypothetical protein